jgi:hypothetical protein
MKSTRMKAVLSYRFSVYKKTAGAGCAVSPEA